MLDLTELFSVFLEEVLTQIVIREIERYQLSFVQNLLQWAPICYLISLQVEYL